ncbi:alpha/beta fold hydrolase [Mycobacterium sp. MAA66]|uniref:alpha/beta fold hydrolase n=1 Tax=Mycobacterium sp. MAA66 TaxID=3156297 RepID=UPI0035136F5C
MTVDLRGVTTVLLPGTGSDDDYVRRAFGSALRQAGAVMCAPAPIPQRLIAGYLQALDDAAREAPILVGGVSLGAAVATNWALAHPDRAIGVLAALPAWTGAPDEAPAALAARYSAQQLREIGLDAAVAGMRAGSPAWLADELTRSWTAQWPALPDAMDEAAGYLAPTSGELEQLTVPMGIAAAADDAVHPIDVARHWATTAPRAVLRTVTLGAMGLDPTVLGSACVDALREASRR